MLSNQGLTQKNFRAALGFIRLAESTFTATAYGYAGLYTVQSLALRLEPAPANGTAGAAKPDASPSAPPSTPAPFTEPPREEPAKGSIALPLAATGGAVGPGRGAPPRAARGRQPGILRNGKSPMNARTVAAR